MKIQSFIHQFGAIVNIWDICLKSKTFISKLGFLINLKIRHSFEKADISLISRTLFENFGNSLKKIGYSFEKSDFHVGILKFNHKFRKCKCMGYLFEISDI